RLWYLWRAHILQGPPRLDIALAPPREQLARVHGPRRVGRAARWDRGEGPRAGRRRGRRLPGLVRGRTGGLRLRRRHVVGGPEGSRRGRARRGRAADGLAVAVRVRRVARRTALRPRAHRGRAAPRRVGPR